MDDKDYAEIMGQLESFKSDPNQKELPLPTGFEPSVIRMTEDISPRTKRGAKIRCSIVSFVYIFFPAVYLQFSKHLVGFTDFIICFIMELEMLHMFKKYDVPKN